MSSLSTLARASVTRCSDSAAAGASRAAPCKPACKPQAVPLLQRAAAQQAAAGLAAAALLFGAQPALAGAAAAPPAPPSSSSSSTLSLSYAPASVKAGLDMRDDAMEYQCVSMFDCDGDRREYAKKQWADFVAAQGVPERKRGGADAAEQPARAAVASD